MSDKAWVSNDFRKFFVSSNHDNVFNLLIKEDLETDDESLVLVDDLKEAYKNDYTGFMDFMVDFYDVYNDELKDELFAWIIDNSEFNNREEIEREIAYYSFFKDVIGHISKYLNTYSLSEALDKCNDEIKGVTKFVLAKYYIDNHLSKNDYLNKSELGKMLYQLVEECFYQRSDLVVSLLHEYQKQEELEKQEYIKKRVNKIVNNAYKKLRNNHYGHDELQSLKTTTNKKLLEYLMEDDLIIQSLNREFDSAISKVHEEKVVVPVINKTKNVVEVPQLHIIEVFYQKHHLYYKKSQITLEIITSPEIIGFYNIYHEIDGDYEDEKKVSKLEELVSDIKESGLKRTESLRRLLSIAQKDIDDYINREDEEEIEIEEEKSSLETKYQEIRKIGKFDVYQESRQSNPLDVNKIMNLIAPQDHQQIKHLNSLIYQIGYDKVQGYLLKSPNMSISNLRSYINLDRSLRFEYQRILEDIEMYFRSSLTYYLSNKYDEKYIQVDSGHWFYKRGYLIKTIFNDAQEHYDMVRQLRERIDDEIKNKNIQVRDEFNRYKYALTFSTAAGIMSFGWIVNMFENINHNDKLEYLRTYFRDVSPQTFCNWLMNLSQLRNRCAHYHSLFRLASLKELRPIMTKDQDANGFDDDYKHSSLFYYTIIMARLSPEVNNIEDFIDALGILFRKVNRENDIFDLSKDYSFPKNWRTILENEKCTRNYNGINEVGI